MFLDEKSYWYYHPTRGVNLRFANTHKIGFTRSPCHLSWIIIALKKTLKANELNKKVKVSSGGLPPQTLTSSLPIITHNNEKLKPNAINNNPTILLLRSCQ